MNGTVSGLIAAAAGTAALAGALIGSGPLAPAAAAVGGAFVAASVALRRHGTQAAALRRALKRRDEQLAHTAHELRTPLTSVLTALEMLRTGYATTADEQAEFLDEADLAARHLAFLVSDVLDGASLAAGRLRLDLADHRIDVLIADAMKVLGLQAERRGIAIATATPSLHTGHDLLVRTDPRRFLQVLFNLVGNAIKFSTKGQPVRIEVAARSTSVRIAVVDHGPGVPRELRPLLFQAFERGTGDGHTPSTGLGLHITRLLVEQMNGAIGYEPGVERGSTFWFELPRPLPREIATPPRDDAAALSPSQRTG